MKLPTNPGEHINQGDGFLSAADREYLLDQRSYDIEQSERNRRQMIRDRTMMGILDLMLVGERLPQHDRDLLFNTISKSDMDDIIDQMVTEGDEGKYPEDRSRIFLIALLEVYGFIERGLVNRGRSRDNIGLLAMLFGNRSKTATRRESEPIRFQLHRRESPRRPGFVRRSA